MTREEVIRMAQYSRVCKVVMADLELASRSRTYTEAISHCNHAEERVTEYDGLTGYDESCLGQSSALWDIIEAARTNVINKFTNIQI